MRYLKLAPLAAVAALALAGCEKKAETPAGSASEEAVPAATALPPSGEASVAAAPKVLPTEIPQAIRGRWGLVPADCTSTRGDAKGLVVIDARSMKFYESVAKLDKVKDADNDGLIATYAFTGEGQTWTLDIALEVEDDGKTLFRKDTGSDALPGTLKYTRCA